MFIKLLRTWKRKCTEVINIFYIFIVFNCSKVYVQGTVSLSQLINNMYFTEEAIYYFQSIEYVRNLLK